MSDGYTDTRSQRSDPSDGIGIQTPQVKEPTMFEQVAADAAQINNFIINASQELGDLRTRLMGDAPSVHHEVGESGPALPGMLGALHNTQQLSLRQLELVLEQISEIARQF